MTLQVHCCEPATCIAKFFCIWQNVFYFTACSTSTCYVCLLYRNPLHVCALFKIHGCYFFFIFKLMDAHSGIRLSLTVHNTSVSSHVLDWFYLIQFLHCMVTAAYFFTCTMHIFAATYCRCCKCRGCHKTVKSISQQRQHQLRLPN